MGEACEASATVGSTVGATSESYHRDRLTWILFALSGYFAYLQGVLGPVVPFLREEFGLGYAAAGSYFAAYSAGSILAGLTGDRLNRAWGRRAVLWSGGAGMAVGTMLLVTGSGVVFTGLGALLMGLAGILLLVGIQAILADRHGGMYASALTESTAAGSVGYVLAPVSVGLFARTEFGWRGALVLAVFIFVALAVLFWREPVPAPAPKERPAEGKGSSSKADADTTKREEKCTRGAASKDRLPALFWVYALILFLCSGVEWCVKYWGADFLRASSGLTAADAALAMGAFFVAMLVARLLGGPLARRARAGSLLGLSLVVTAVGFPLFWLSPASLVSVAGLFIAGLGIANLNPFATAIGVRVAPEKADEAAARLAVAVGLAGLIAPYLLGWLAEGIGLFGAYGIVVPLVVVALVSTMVGARLTSRSKPAGNGW